MNWVRNHPLAASLGALLLSGSLLVVMVGYVGLVVFSALVTEAAVLNVVGDLAFPYLPIVALLMVITTVSGIGLAWTLLRRFSLPQGGRLHTLTEYGEQRSSMLNALSLSELVAPPKRSAERRAEDVFEALKQQYVEGDIDEYEFEQMLDLLVANDSMDDARAVRESERD